MWHCPSCAYRRPYLHIRISSILAILYCSPSSISGKFDAVSGSDIACMLEIELLAMSEVVTSSVAIGMQIHNGNIGHS